MSDAILIGENWISEHYFGTDATAQSFHARVLVRRKAWDAEEKDGRDTPRSRFTAARGGLATALARITADLADGEGGGAPDDQNVRVQDELIRVLGLEGPGLSVERTGPIAWVSSIGIVDHAPLGLLRAAPVATLEQVLAKDADTLSEPVRLDEDGPEHRSVSRLVSALFVEEKAPDLIVVLAGRWVLLAERERWAEGRYLALDVQAVAERNDTRHGGEIDTMLTCLSAESVAPDADGELWWKHTLDESVKHTVGVSQDLREGVRLSIEIIANEVVNRRVARGLTPLPGDQAQPLARQSLRFLYRILFLLYAEASPELGVLPIGAQQYEEGYSLDRLRDLVQVVLATPQSQAGTHLYQSLGVLFRLVERGNEPAPTNDDEPDERAEGLAFHPLRSDLFRPQATALIDEVGLGNQALQRVLAHLLLSKEKRGRDRGFISYAELGINQLGAVYEGLMSYTGFFAETDLYEVARNGDASKGSWVVPVERADELKASDFVRETGADGAPRPVLHRRGSFVFRLAGRERQQSASYYTPEVLTRFTVGQALAELLDQDGRTTTAAEILDLTVCEPALGSGAFAIEAVRQLATQYLDRRQKELGRRLDPDSYPVELQRVKAYLALHNVYGVDLNATAVELAEISLWLDTMVRGLSAPWFGLHLRRGNSLIGARRAVYSRAQVSDKSWLTAVPREIAMGSLAADVEAGTVGTGLDRGIHHFLLPAEGWGAAADAKEAAALAPEAAKALKTWRRSMRVKPSKRQLDDLSELAHRIELLWQFALRRLTIAEQEIRRDIPVWQAGELPSGGAVQREQIEEALADADGAYRRVKRVMDAWCALWFWPLTEPTRTVQTEDGPAVVEPPSLDEWIAGLQALLGRSPEVRSRKPLPNNQTLSSAAAWEDLGQAEALELGMAGAAPVATALRDHPWLVVCGRVSEAQGFFHWSLDFAPIFAAASGFALQVGNPPWVQPEFSLAAAIGEIDAAALLTTSQDSSGRRTWLGNASVAARNKVVDYSTQESVISSYLRSSTIFTWLHQATPDLYKGFLEIALGRTSATGITALVHSASILQEARGGLFREQLFRRARQIWHFVNEKKAI